jgi:hypothetical protein
MPADFYSWSKESLVKFAEEAETRLAEQDETIKNLHAAWRTGLAYSVPFATLNPQQPLERTPP